MKPLFCLTVFVFFEAAGIPSSYANDRWPQFRGPDSQGTALLAQPPVEFGLTQSIKWRTSIEGKGWSSPVVDDGRIWITTAVAQAATPEESERRLGGNPTGGVKEVARSMEIRAVCVDFESGSLLHNLVLASFVDPDPINPLNTFASPTPVMNDGMVFCDFGNYGTWCLDAETGKTIWQHRIVVDYSVGPGSSPIVHGDKLIRVCDGIDQQFIVALDKATGSEVWRTARPPMRTENVEFRKAYSTPLVISVHEKPQVVVPGAQWICGYDPDNGHEIWRIDHGSGFSVSPMPILVNGLVVFSTGFMRPELVAVKPDGQGDVTNTHVMWRVSRGAPTKPSAIAVGQRIYMVSDTGVLTQLRVEDGSIVWQERLAGNFSASPILAGDHLYFCSHEGIVIVVKPGERFVEVARNELEPRILASPAVIGNDLVFRTEDALLRIGN